MKKIGMLIIVIILMTVVTTAQAEVRTGSVSFTPFAGVYFFEGNQDLKNSPIVGLRAGYNFTENLGMEGFFSFAQTTIQDKSQWDPWQDVYSYGIEGLYHFMPNSRFVPFIAIGLGGIYYSKGLSYANSSYGERFESNKFAVDYGAGLKFFLTDHIALRADVRHVLPMNSKGNDPNDFLATFGINFAFGGEKKIAETKVEEHAAPEEVVVDSDNDGVPDNLDKCPGTPVRTAVDKNGCPRLPDSDMDGVVDYFDKCPGTPPNVIVDKDGCPPIVEQKQEAHAQVPDKVFIALNLQFDTGKAVVKRKYYKAVKKVADFMKEHPKTKVVIHGHTDNVGNKASNIRLSKARAESVRKCLIDNFGIKASRITAVGHGPNKPIASNEINTGRQKNRRIEAAIEAVQIK